MGLHQTTGAVPLINLDEVAADGAAVLDAEYYIGTKSCLPKSACHHLKGDVGDYSCIGEEACSPMKGKVGDNACIGEGACREVEGNKVGDNSCRGPFSCTGLTVNVGTGSCIGKNACDMSDETGGKPYYGRDIPDNCLSLVDLEVGKCNNKSAPDTPLTLLSK